MGSLTARCVIAREAVVVTNGFCFNTDDRCVGMDTACVEAAGACFITNGACVEANGACVEANGACFVTDDPLFVTDAPLFNTPPLSARCTGHAVVPSNIPIASKMHPRGYTRIARGV